MKNTKYLLRLAPRRADVAGMPGFELRLDHVDVADSTRRKLSEPFLVDAESFETLLDDLQEQIDAAAAQVSSSRSPVAPAPPM